MTVPMPPSGLELFLGSFDPVQMMLFLFAVATGVLIADRFYDGKKANETGPDDVKNYDLEWTDVILLALSGVFVTLELLHMYPQSPNSELFFAWTIGLVIRSILPEIIKSTIAHFNQNK